MDLYAKYHLLPGDERRELFQILQEEFHCHTGIYPGCLVHVTPSFYFPAMIYVDRDRRALQFFNGGAAERLVAREKRYPGEPLIEFHLGDYRKPLPIADESVDLLVSQYAGFVSEACARYLRPGGLLVANDSHGDAGLARCDPSFEFIGVLHRRGECFRLSTDRLGDYFVRESAAGLPARRDLGDYLKGLGHGLHYVTSAEDYLFRKRP